MANTSPHGDQLKHHGKKKITQHTGETIKKQTEAEHNNTNKTREAWHWTKQINLFLLVAIFLFVVLFDANELIAGSAAGVAIALVGHPL